jgi:8-hydroxy-5-deazaflavin:NADPH oxidoreductase
MRIAVLGGGHVGSALAESWREKGHDVSMSTRETVAETAAAGDVVVLAVPATAATDVLGEAGSLDGKILVDATNNLSGGPPGLVIAELVPGARYVKAFNAVFATFMHDAPTSPPASLVFSGEDPDAKATVAELIRDVGLEPVDAGGLEVTPLVEAFAQLIIGIAYRQGRGPFAYRFQPS